jgi:hypothetical protein
LEYYSKPGIIYDCQVHCNSDRLGVDLSFVGSQGAAS